MDCCLFVFYINSDRNIENVKTCFSLREKKKDFRRSTSLVLIRMVTGDFTGLYKSYSYSQGGPGDSNQQSHDLPDTDMKPTYERTKPQVFFKQKVKRLHETLETRVKCDHC